MIPAALLLAVATVLTVQPPAGAATIPTCFGKNATIVGTNGNDTIQGTSGNDVIVALNGDDVVYGGAGNDLICGGYGADQLHGGPGNDQIAGELGRVVQTANGTRIKNDVLYGDAGDDLFSPGYDGRHPSDVPDRITFHDAPNGVTVDANTHTATGEGNDTWLGDNAEIDGSQWGDTMIGGPRRDIFNGGGGSDTIRGNGGDDTLRDDYQGSDMRQADTLDGGDGNDQLFTFGGFDTLIGGNGNDTLSDYSRDAGSMEGGPGNDTISDGIAMDAQQVIDGGPGTDTVTVYTDMMRYWPRLAVNLTAATGTFQSSSPVTFRMSSTDKLYVHGAPLTYVGDAGDNTVWIDGTGGLDANGEDGNDTFYGRDGYDQYVGGNGIDKVYTGGGHDNCTTVEVIFGTCTAP